MSGWAVWVLLAAAADPLSGVHVQTFAAPEGCPTVEHFERSLRARIDVDNAAEATVRARIERLGRRFKGTVEISRGGREFAPRAVDALDCTELVEALALIAGFALAVAPEPPRDAPVDEPPPRIATEEPPLAATPAISQDWEPRLSIPPPGPMRPWDLLFGVGLSGHLGGLPKPALGLVLFLGVEHATLGAARIAAEWSQVTIGVGDQGRGQFAWLLLRGSACPWSWAWAGTRAEPCVAFEGGLLQARGVDVPSAALRRRGWLAPGLLGRLVWEGASPLLVELQVGAFAPLIRDRFYFPPDTVVHRADPVRGMVNLQVAFRFQ